MNAANKNSPIGTGWYAHLENAVKEFMNSSSISGDVTEAVTQYFLMDKNSDPRPLQASGATTGYTAGTSQEQR